MESEPDAVREVFKFLQGNQKQPENLSKSITDEFYKWGIPLKPFDSKILESDSKIEFVQK